VNWRIVRRIAITLPILLILAFAIICTSCTTPTESTQFDSRKLQKPNPTWYRFHVPIGRIREALKQKKVRCCGDEIEFADDVLFSKGVLDIAGNEQDAYIHNFHTPIGPSPVYVQRGTPLPYLCEFHLHVVATAHDLTRVTVVPLKSEVISGETLLGIHGGHANIYQSVVPTTIEEYRILLELGAAVGESGMPPINLPENNLPNPDK
jgi:hypothetical protein